MCILSHIRKGDEVSLVRGGPFAQMKETPRKHRRHLDAVSAMVPRAPFGM